jgi:CNT family concentrative nucleoside transporter
MVLPLKDRPNHFRMVLYLVGLLYHKMPSHLTNYLSVRVIAFRFIPNRIVTKPVAAVWIPAVQRPWYSLSYPIRLTIGWLCLVGIIFGSAFGFKLPQGSSYPDRVISIAGLFIFQLVLWLTSKHRSQVPW